MRHTVPPLSSCPLSTDKRHTPKSLEPDHPSLHTILPYLLSLSFYLLLNSFILPLLFPPLFHLLFLSIRPVFPSLTIPS